MPLFEQRMACANIRTLVISAFVGNILRYVPLYGVFVAYATVWRILKSMLRQRVCYFSFVGNISELRYIWMCYLGYFLVFTIIGSISE